jgi:hypothetical protein
MTDLLDAFRLAGKCPTRPNGSNIRKFVSDWLLQILMNKKKKKKKKKAVGNQRLFYLYLQPTTSPDNNSPKTLILETCAKK